MKLIIDSGGTKADWAVIDGVLKARDTGAGIRTREDTKLEIPVEITPYREEITEIYYYGAGLYSKKRSVFIFEIFKSAFPNANIKVESDLLAAARATALTSPAIVCILGTGSNSCVYDGTNILHNITPLGFIIGDEGGGTTIGKEVLKGYFYNEMPESTKKIFEQKYPNLSKTRVLNAVNDMSQSAAYISSFAKFPNEVDCEYLSNMVKSELKTYLTRRVMPYKEYKTYPLHFVGSIAYFYRSHIKSLCSDTGQSLGQILRKPITGLIEYHK